MLLEVLFAYTIERMKGFILHSYKAATQFILMQAIEGSD